MELLGTVVNGVVVIGEGAHLPDGTRVRLAVVEPAPNEATLGQRLLRFAGTMEGLPEDLAENHDHYLHGRPRR